MIFELALLIRRNNSTLHDEHGKSIQVALYTNMKVNSSILVREKLNIILSESFVDYYYGSNMFVITRSSIGPS